jgi:hypothetical protein
MTCWSSVDVMGMFPQNHIISHSLTNIIYIYIYTFVLSFGDKDNLNNK